ncbi:SGNH/GDSL hydrolase family protein [Dysosmobacter sp. Phy]
MRILMLGNSLTFTNDMPRVLARLTGAEVVLHTRGGARLSEHLNPGTKLGARTQAALRNGDWDYVVLQEMSHGPITSPASFFSSVERLSDQARESGAVPVLYATWAYRKGSSKLAAKGWDYDEMARGISEAYHRAAKKSRTLIADVGWRFYQLSNTQELYASDGVHPNDQGSRIAAETIAAAIQTDKERQ